MEAYAILLLEIKYRRLRVCYCSPASKVLEMEMFAEAYGIVGRGKPVKLGRGTLDLQPISEHCLGTTGHQRTIQGTPAYMRNIALRLSVLREERAVRTVSIKHWIRRFLDEMPPWFFEQRGHSAAEPS